MLIPLLAGAAAALAVPPPPGKRLTRLSVAPRPAGRRERRTAPVAVAAVGSGMLVIAGLGVSGLGWAITAGIIVGLTCWLVIAGFRRKAAERCADDVASAARLLASLLRSGQIASEALREAADDHSVLREAAAVAALGGDVAAALAARSAQPGAEGLGAIAAAWRVSERSGAPVAGILERVADTLREERRLRGVVETELASARTSGHIMAVLPLAAVGLGLLAGINSLGFLFGHPLGQWLCAVAMGLTAVGVFWIERLAGR